MSPEFQNSQRGNIKKETGVRTHGIEMAWFPTLPSRFHLVTVSKVPVKVK